LPDRRPERYRVTEYTPIQKTSGTGGVSPSRTSLLLCFQPVKTGTVFGQYKPRAPSQNCEAENIPGNGLPESILPILPDDGITSGYRLMNKNSIDGRNRNIEELNREIR